MLAAARAFRRTRSSIKKKIRDGSIFDKRFLAKYHLRRYRAPKKQPRDREQLVNELRDKKFSPYHVIVPKDFSFLDAPESTSSFLGKLGKDLNTKMIQNVKVFHEETRSIELSASWIFDNCIKSLREKCHAVEENFFLGGTTSSIRAVNNFLMANGFFREMGIGYAQIAKSVDFDYANKFKLFRKSGSKSVSHLKGNAATELVAYFNSCLNHLGKRLTKVGGGKLVDAFGEIIGNAEEHGGDGVQWHVSGCFEKDTNYLNFSIINHGPSIYETLSDNKSTTKVTLEKIQKVVLSHRNVLAKSTDFLVKDERWIQTIWTVMALQEGISSKRTLDEEGITRGQGLMDVLEFIKEASSTDNPKLAIISGHSYILVDYEYPLTKEEIGPSKEIRRQISFNKDQGLHYPQDGQKVKFLAEPFPGTIITARFKMAAAYVKDRRNSE
jgi:hypothetical protein